MKSTPTSAFAQFISGGSGVGDQQPQQQRGTPKQHSIPLEILDDLGSRFIINLPEDQRKDLIRICFQIEIAHWFYIDEYVSNKEKANSYQPRLRQCWLREFAEHMFRHIGFLRVHADNVDQILEDFKAYKLAVPTYGGIILNEDLSKVLLVLGYWSRTSWGFPKGKVNEDEPPHLCAVREVLEETGYDMSAKIDPDEYILKEISGQRCCLYMIPGVPEDTQFAPRTQREIRDIQWFPIAGLPNSKKEEITDDPVLNPFNVSFNNLFMVMPFVSGIRRWISKKFNPGGRNGRKESSKNSIRSQRRHAEFLARKNSSMSDMSATDQASSTTPVVTAAADHQKAEVVPDLTPDFVPKSWSGFRINKKALLAAIDSTPGWVQQPKHGGGQTASGSGGTKVRSS